MQGETLKFVNMHILQHSSTNTAVFRNVLSQILLQT